MLSVIFYSLGFQVPGQKGKQAASKNKSGQEIGFLAVDELLKDCEVVDEADRASIERSLYRKIKSGEAELENVRNRTNEELKQIVEERSKCSKLYAELEYKAQITEAKEVSKMTRNFVVDIHNVMMTELSFVNCFKPHGHLCDDVFEILRLLMKESGERGKIMLSRGAVVSAN